MTASEEGEAVEEDTSLVKRFMSLPCPSTVPVDDDDDGRQSDFRRLRVSDLFTAVADMITACGI